MRDTEIQFSSSMAILTFYHSKNCNAINIKELELKYDSQFEDIYGAIQFLMTENKEIATYNERTKIGYKK